jgi:hypothetical protein
VAPAWPKIVEMMLPRILMEFSFVLVSGSVFQGSVVFDGQAANWALPELGKRTTVASRVVASPYVTSSKAKQKDDTGRSRQFFDTAGER